MDKFETDILKWFNNNNNNYIRLGSDISVTELMQPVRMVQLINRHRVKVDQSELSKVIPSLMGNGIHDQLQRFLKMEATINPGSWLVERRLVSVYDGVRIAGRFDALYNYEDLYDIKSTSTYKYEHQEFDEWEEQLNVYDYLLSLDNINLKTLKVILISTDWVAANSWKKEYPDSRFEIIPMKRWSRTMQQSYLNTHITTWKDSKELPDDKLPLCTQKDRWANTPEFKLYRTPDMQRCYKSFTEESRAKSYLKACKAGKNAKSWVDAVIKEETKNPWKRCSWCDAQPFCNQFADKLEP